LLRPDKRPTQTSALCKKTITGVSSIWIVIWGGEGASSIRTNELRVENKSEHLVNLKRNKDEFIRGAERIESLVTAYATHVRQEIRGKIVQQRDALVEALLPGVTATPPRSWLKQSVDGKLSEATLRNRLEAVVDAAFKTIAEEFDPRVIWVFKGVAYETIKQDDSFREGLEKHFGKDEAAKLLSEYAAARAHEKRNQ
jgi:hypothetical protein